MDLQMTLSRMTDSAVVEYCSKALLDMFLFIPRPRLTNTIKVAMAAASKRYPTVLVLCEVWMANHEHLILFAPDNDASDWIGHMHQVVAESINREFSRSEKVFSGKQSFMACIHSMRQLVGRITYILSNPTKAGIARSYRDYHGVVICAENEPREIEVVRSEPAFSPRSRVLKEGTIRVAGLNEVSEYFAEHEQRDVLDIERQAKVLAHADAARNAAQSEAPKSSSSTTDEHTDKHTDEQKLSPEEEEMLAIDELFPEFGGAGKRGDIDYAAIVKRAVLAREAFHRQEWEARGVPIPTAKVMAERNAEMLKNKVWQSPPPGYYEKKAAESGRRAPRPYFYSSREEREFRERRHAAFLEAYREARAQWLAGGTDVVFPRGTTKMRGLPNVVIDTGPPELRLPVET